MRRWLTNPRVQILLPDDPSAPGPGTWARLQDDLGWLEHGDERWLPAGFAWNGASIPRPLWTIMGHPLQNRALRASAFHDDGWRQRVEPASVVHRRFYEGLRADGEPWLKATLFWRAVQLAEPSW
jgi:hypothetical protein